MLLTTAKFTMTLMLLGLLGGADLAFCKANQKFAIPAQPNPTAAERLYHETTLILNGTFADPTPLKPLVADHYSLTNQYNLWGSSFLDGPPQFAGEKDSITNFLAKNSQISINDRLKAHFEPLNRFADGFKWEWNFGEDSRSARENGPKYGLVVQRITTSPSPRRLTLDNEGENFLVERNANVVWTIAPIETPDISPTPVNSWEFEQPSSDNSGSNLAHPWWRNPPEKRFSGKLIPKNSLGINGATPGVRAELFQTQNIYRFIYETPERPGASASSEHICEFPVTQAVTFGQVFDQQLGPKRSTIGTEILGAASRIHYEFSGRKYIAEAVKYYYNWKIEMSSEAGYPDQSTRIVPLGVGVKILKDF
jgi:hypothetical protein